MIYDILYWYIYVWLINIKNLFRNINSYLKQIFKNEQYKSIYSFLKYFHIL